MARALGFLTRRPLTPDEVRIAEDDQTLDLVATQGPATVGRLALALLGVQSTHPRGSREVYVLDWTEDMDIRRASLRPVLGRLRKRRLVRLVGRRWTITKAGATAAGFNTERWPWHRRRGAQIPPREAAAQKTRRCDQPHPGDIQAGPKVSY